MTVFRNILRLGGALILIATLSLGGFAALHWTPDRSVAELQARWALPPSTFVEIDGMRVHLRDEGPRDEQTPIVLIHGTSSSLHTWDGWADELQRSRRVIRFDLPGFGLTGPAPHGDYGIRRYAEFVIRLLDQLGIERATLAGNSLGGNIAWMTAALAPERVEGLILISASGYAVSSNSVPIGFRIASIPLLNTAMQSVLPRSLVRSSVENVFGDPAKVTDEIVDRYFDLATRSGNRAAMVKRFTQLSPGSDTDLIRGITQPTLILWGARDQLIPLAAGKQFATDIPNNRFIVFDELGHIPQEEEPARSLQPVLSFLDEPVMQ